MSLSLKEISKKRIFKEFLKLPKFLLEELSEDFKYYYIQEEKKKAVSNVLKQIKKEGYIIVDEIIEKLIISQKSGKDFTKPCLAKDLDNRIYGIYLNIAENIVRKYNQIYFPLINNNYVEFMDIEEYEYENIN